MGPIDCPKMSVTNYHSAPRRTKIGLTVIILPFVMMCISICRHSVQISALHCSVEVNRRLIFLPAFVI